MSIGIDRGMVSGYQLLRCTSVLRRWSWSWGIKVPHLKKRLFYWSVEQSCRLNQKTLTRLILNVVHSCRKLIGFGEFHSTAGTQDETDSFDWLMEEKSSDHVYWRTTQFVLFFSSL